MFLEEVATKVLVNSGKFTDSESACNALKAEFKTQFPTYEYNHWNQEIPDSIANNIISNVGKNGNVSIRFVIKDLEIIANTI